MADETALKAHRDEMMREQSIHRMRDRFDWFIRRHQPEDLRDRHEFIADLFTLMNASHLELVEAFGRHTTQRFELYDLAHRASFDTILREPKK